LSARGFLALKIGGAGRIRTPYLLTARLIAENHQNGGLFTIGDKKV